MPSGLKSPVEVMWFCSIIWLRLTSMVQKPIPVYSCQVLLERIMSLTRVVVYFSIILLVFIQKTISLNHRLPNNITPLHYQLNIISNIADLNSNFTFSGKVWIVIECKTATRDLVLHSKDLQIDEETIRVQSKTPPSTDISNQKTLNISRISYDKDFDFLIIHLNENVERGNKYEIFISFSGELTPGLAGFYRSSYKSLETGEIKWLAVTQFESIDARRAFPCFDEPAIKARFTVHLGHINTKKAVSNMPLNQTEPIEGMDGWVWDKFEETVPMSTYLLAFLVSDFEYLTSAPSKTNNVTFRTWARKDAIDQVKFAAEIGPKVLEDYELYFGIKYPLPKQDMVAVPDFSAGAMENWGLITYRETALLVDKNFTSPTAIPNIVYVIAHEIAHQWFGNLVTMKWWTDLWLNEGFATYVATLETHNLFPDWDSLNESIAEDLIYVLSLDSLKSSHPISVPISHPREIPQIFDAISYKKGAYVLRMMNLFLGEGNFRSGVSNYLRHHAYSSAEQDDLWGSLTEEAQKNEILPKGLTVKKIMDTWTLQTGYPLITVARNHSSGEAKITQRRYFAETENVTHASPYRTSWYVPITYTTQRESNFSRTMPRLWLSPNETHTNIYNLSKDDWVMLNMQAAGLYRINYDDENWNKIIKSLQTSKYKEIHVINRVQIINDAFQLARTGDLDYKIPFEILQYLKQDDEYLPWLAAWGELSQIHKALRNYPLFGNFKKYAVILVEPLYQKTKMWVLPNTPANLPKLHLKNLMFNAACKLNIGDCREIAAKQFRKWMNETNPDRDNPVPINSRFTIYCHAIKQGGEKEWDFAWERYLRSNTAAHKSTILRTLTCTKEPWLLNRYLKWSIDEESGVKRQDTVAIFSGIARNDLGYYLAKNFLLSKIKEISKYHGFRANRLSAYMSSLLSQVTEERELKEFAEFSKVNHDYLLGAQKAIQQSIESSSINVKWHERFYDPISLVLEDQLKR